MSDPSPAACSPPVPGRVGGGLSRRLPAAGEALDAGVLLAERGDLEAVGAVEADRFLIRLRVERAQVLLSDHRVDHLRSDAVAAEAVIHGDVEEERRVPSDALDTEDANRLPLFLPDVEPALRDGVDRRQQVI